MGQPCSCPSLENSDGVDAARCQRLPCREATAGEVGACHRPDLFARLEAASLKAGHLAQPGLEDSEDEDSCVYFTADTYVSPSTAMCARLAAGASVDVAVAVATYAAFPAPSVLSGCFWPFVVAVHQLSAAGQIQREVLSCLLQRCPFTAQSLWRTSCLMLLSFGSIAYRIDTAGD